MESTRPDFRRFRFLFADFFVMMWLLNALERRNFPLPVVLKRLAAPRLLFILGIVTPVWSQYYKRIKNHIFKFRNCQDIFGRSRTAATARKKDSWLADLECSVCVLGADFRRSSQYRRGSSSRKATSEEPVSWSCFFPRAWAIVPQHLLLQCRL